jgi:hypothetical protein
VSDSDSKQATLAEQKRQVKSGCTSVLGCLLIVGLAAAWYLGIGWWLTHSVSTRADNLIVFAELKIIRNAVFACSLFVPVILVFGLAMVKSRTMAIAVTVGLGLAIGAAGWFAWYRPFAAIAFHGESVELQYLWPRPATRIHRREIVSTDWRRGSRIASPSSTDVYTLVLVTTSHTYVSFDDAAFSDIELAQRRLR